MIPATTSANTDWAKTFTNLKRSHYLTDMMSVDGGRSLSIRKKGGVGVIVIGESIGGEAYLEDDSGV